MLEWDRPSEPNFRDFEDCSRSFKQAKKGYEEQLGPNSQKALKATYVVLAATGMSRGEKIEKLRVLVERMVRALGEERRTL